MSDIEIIDEEKSVSKVNSGKGGASNRGNASSTARGTGRNTNGVGRGGVINGPKRNLNSLIQVSVGRGNARTVSSARPTGNANLAPIGAKPFGNMNRNFAFATKGGAFPNTFDDRLSRYQDYLDSNIKTKLAAFKNRDMKNLPVLDRTEKKFSGRSHLYVGGISQKSTEKDIKEWFGEFGEVGDVYYKKDKLFAFVKMATRLEAEKAKAALDGQTKNDKTLRVKFSVHQAAIKVSNLGPWTSNELLHAGFSVFGEIERCLVYSDEKGKSKEEGVVEFVKKGVAMEAVRRCNDGCFFLCTSLRPVYAEMITHAEDEDGVPEKALPKHSNEYNLERETGPRFAVPGTFQYEYGTKWKGLYELKKQKEEALQVEMKLEEAKLVAQMEYSRFEHETDLLREELKKKEAIRDQQKSMWSIKEKYMEDIMKQEQEKQRSLEEGIFNRIQSKADSQDEDQDVVTIQDQEPDVKEEGVKLNNVQSSLFSQAQQLSSILDLQEALMGNGSLLNSLPDEGTLETLNALFNLQGTSGNKRMGSVFDRLGGDIDVEDMHLQAEQSSRASKRRKS